MIKEYNIYQVGGSVRDSLLGLDSKDIDFVVVFGILPDEPVRTPEYQFQRMEYVLRSDGYEIFLIKEDCYTIRAKFPKGHEHENLVADFVMSRKEVGLIPGTRTPILEIGTLADDLVRRDFTINSMAIVDGLIIDAFGGKQDLINKIIRTNLDASISFRHDPLRILRAIRFAITKDFDISEEIWNAIKSFDLDLLKVVSVDRRREELNKMFQHDTIRTLRYLERLQCWNPKMYRWIFSEGLKLEATNKEKLNVK